MSGTHGTVHHRSGYFYTILEEDYCDLFRGTGKNEICRAYLASIFEHLTNRHYDPERTNEPIWVYMSLPEMARRMRHAYSERTIHKELQGMIADGYLQKRRAAGKATMEYCLNIHKLNIDLAALPEKQPVSADVQSCNSARLDVAELQDGSCNSARTILQNNKINLANLQPRYTTRYTEDIPEDRHDSVMDADASHDTPAPVQDEGVSVSVPSPLPVAAPAPVPEKPASRKKPTAAKTAKAERDEVTAKRIASVYDAMDAFKQQATGDPSASWQRTKVGSEAIADLLKQNPTREKLLLVCQDMWNDRGHDGSYFWRKNMSPKNICKQYESRILALTGRDIPIQPRDARKDVIPRVDGVALARKRREEKERYLREERERKEREEREAREQSYTSPPVSPALFDIDSQLLAAIGG